MALTESKSLTFEQAVDQLEEVLKKIEDGDVPLNTLVDNFEQGMQLIQKCEADWKSAELRIEQIKQTKNTSHLDSFEDPPSLFD